MTNQKRLSGLSILALVALMVSASMVQAQTTNIIEGGPTNYAGDYYLGSNTANNALIIQNNGSLSNLNGYVGYNESGDSNTVMVTGSGSAWTNTGNLIVGGGVSTTFGDYNTLIISNGARVYNSGVGMVGGGYESRYNTAYVDGEGSIWTNGSWLAVGAGDLWTFDNGLIVRNGGKVFSTTARSGLAGKSAAETCHNYAIIDGTGSLWQAGSDFCSACGGSELIITNGGKLLCSAVYLSCGGIGARVIVTGSGSCWSNSPGGNWDGLGVNFSKSSTLIVTNGGKFYTGSALRIGWSSAATGNVYKATGNNSLIEVGGSSGVTIGNNNTIIAENGGQWKANVMIGGGPSAVAGSSNCNNRIESRGAGSLISVPTLYVGDRVSSFTYCSNNTCIVSNGGSITNTYCYVGPQANAYSNIVRVSGSGSYFRSSTELNIGEKGSYNDFRVDGGALAQAGTCNIGSSTTYPTNNTLTVTGSGTIFSNTTLNVGNSGGGQGNGVLIGDGGSLKVGNVANVYSNAYVTNYFQGSSSGLDILNDNDSALTIATGGKVHIVFERNGYNQGQFYWVLRWAGNHTSVLNTLHDSGKLTWDTGSLQGQVRISYDTTNTYVGFVQTAKGTIFTLR